MIPCVIVQAYRGTAPVEVSLLRPSLEVMILRPLQHLAQAHPKRYCSCAFTFLALPSLFSAMFLNPSFRGVLTLLFNSFMFVAFLAIISSRQYNLDKVAVKYVALSFRFAVFVVLLSQWIALDVRRAYLVLSQGPTSIYVTTFWDVAAVAVLALFFCVCLLLDCSPNLPAVVQIFVTVRGSNATLVVHAAQFLNIFIGVPGWMVDDFWILVLP
jgi:hypothetical protein